MLESEIIAKILTPLARGSSAALNFADDCAIFDIPQGKELLCSKDIMHEGIHFLGTENASDIAKKLMRVNISDIASMGGTPLYCMIGLGLPSNIGSEWIEHFASGILQDLQEFNCHLIGGDTTNTMRDISLSLTIFGIIDRGKALLRSGAKIGDDIYVSGNIGDPYLGLQILQGKLHTDTDKYFINKYLIPQSRVKLGQKLINVAHSATDISDGLITDLRSICNASDVGAYIEGKKIPLSNQAKSLGRNKSELINKGDDYELLFTAPKIHRKYIQSLGKITIIGKITKKDIIINELNVDVGYEHKF